MDALFFKEIAYMKIVVCDFFEWYLLKNPKVEIEGNVTYRLNNWVFTLFTTAWKQLFV